MKRIAELDELVERSKTENLSKTISKGVDELVAAYKDAVRDGSEYINIGLPIIWDDEEVDEIVAEMRELGITKFVYGAVSSSQWDRLYRFVQDGAKVEGVEMVLSRKNGGEFNWEKSNAYYHETGEFKDFYDDRYEPMLVMTLE